MKIVKLEVYGIIYKIQNLVNNKVYIGQTINERGFDGRYPNGNVEKYTDNEHLRRSIKKYGIEKFEINRILDIAFSKKELDIKEQCWISIYNSTNCSKGYNKNTGGSNGKPNKETLKKMSESKKGKLHSRIHIENLKKYQSNRPIEHNINISKSKKGCISPFLGKHHTQENIIKFSELASKKVGELNPFFGHKHSEETKKKISESKKGRKTSAQEIENFKKARKGKGGKKVICITTGKVFACMVEGAEYYNINNSTDISACCRGKQKSAGKLEDGTKLVWSYFYAESEVA